MAAAQRGTCMAAAVAAHHNLYCENYVLMHCCHVSVRRVVCWPGSCKCDM
jgi:hypothetical protein